MKTAIVWDEAYADHDTGGHPEGVARIATIVAHLEQSSLWPQIDVVKPTPATEADVLRVHTPAHVEMIRHAGAGGGHWIDADTFVSPQSFAIALLAAGGVLSAITRWDEGEVPFALVRPPGHHATPDRAMGFCLFNNIAIAAASLLERGYERIAIIDWDVHHGNGTQAIFYDRGDVLTVSIHGDPMTEYPFFLGHADERGTGAGFGCNLNLPLPRGTDFARWRAALRTGLDAIRAFGADALVVALGVDTFEGDPISGFLLRSGDYLQVGRDIAGAQLPTVFTFEGGYAVAEVGVNTVNVLEGFEQGG
jgi:acetoin utilization deacetylase AcuC-like enzyme